MYKGYNNIDKIERSYTWSIINAIWRFDVWNDVQNWEIKSYELRRRSRSSEWEDACSGKERRRSRNVIYVSSWYHANGTKIHIEESQARI